MDKYPEDAVLIRRYLLGETSEEDGERVESLLMSDRETFEIAQAIEDELADDYVMGVLTQDERADFETVYLSCKERNQKVSFAQLMNSYSALGADRLAKKDPAGTPFPLSNVLRVFGIPLNRFTAVFACVAVGMIVVSGLLLVRNRILLTKVKEATLHEHMAAEEAAHVRSEFLVEKEHATELEHRVAGPTSQEKLRGDQMVQLLPGVFRGDSSITSVSILKGTQIVELDLKVVTRPHEEYRISLCASNSKEIAARTGAKALKKTAGIFVPFTFLPNEIPPGEYTIVLQTAGENGTTIPLADYHFRIEHNR